MKSSQKSSKLQSPKKQSQFVFKSCQICYLSTNLATLEAVPRATAGETSPSFCFGSLAILKEYAEIQPVAMVVAWSKKLQLAAGENLV